MTLGISSHQFSIHSVYAPLASSLPDYTSIYHEWPRENLRVNLPESISIATMTPDGPVMNKIDEDSLPRLMGKPIHVLEGDRIEISLENNLPSTGLSLHFHGFEMKDALVYDGVVGITQCAVSPYESFSYNFTVDEVPGTYWYHTHSGSLGVDSYNAIKGPLIVHPRDSLGYAEIMNKDDSTTRDYKDLLSYGNERILFFSDGFLTSDSHMLLYSMGGLTPPNSKNEDGFTVGTINYEFGTCNGKLREVVNVLPGQTYKFRLLNGGSHFAFRIHIDGISMKVVAADSEPVKPYKVDEVILHAAERFDVEITIPSEFIGGERFWIRADTLESTEQGYQNGIRAVLNVVETFSFPSDSDVPDPVESIVRASKRIEDRKTMNCYSRHEGSENIENQGSCIQITELEPLEDALILDGHNILTEASDIHTVDFEFSPPPQFAHFVTIDGGLSIQHENPLKAMLEPSFDYSADSHPNTAMLHLPSHSAAIIIWRSESLVDHPIHLHGYKMEILAIDLPIRNRDCTLSKCKLSTAFESARNITAMDKIPKGSSVVKDTFILPAGGAVMTRIQTGVPALWFAHCHSDIHRDDGMAFILNVGNYQPPSNNTWLPKDYPSCDTPFLKTRNEHPACNCYIDNDAVLGRALTKDHRCSRDHLCLHVQSRAANLDSYENSGFRISSDYAIANWVITFIVVLTITLTTALIVRVMPYQRVKVQNCQMEFSSTNSALHKLRIRIVKDYEGYRPGCTNVLRVFEVTGLALLTGYLFYDVGNDSTATGLSEKYSLLFFSITLWTFTRMYPAIPNYNAWFKALQLKCNGSVLDTAIWCGSRCIVVAVNEAWWPMIHCFVCYPMAGMFNHISSVIIMSIFLALNTICYVSLGGTLGVLFDFVPLGMCMSTIVSQTTLVAAGFYTNLPVGVSWIRYISPVFWTYRGIVKTFLRWTDTYACLKGQSDVGSNQCYLEFSPGIDALKRRGINVATFNDSQSDKVYLEATMLCLLFLGLQTIIFLVSWGRARRKNVDDTVKIDSEKSDSLWNVDNSEETNSEALSTSCHATMHSDCPSSIDEKEAPV